MKKINQDISGVVKLLTKTLQDSYGFEVEPMEITGTDPISAPEGYFFYVIRAWGADAVINTITTPKGDTSTIINGTTVTDGDYLYYPIKTIDLTSGSAIGYLQADLVV